MMSRATSTRTSAILTAPELCEVGVAHAFSTRRGGVSCAPFDSLNFGNPGELPEGISRDPKATIIRNFRTLIDVLGMDEQTTRIAQVHQVHGADVLLLPRDGEPRLVDAETRATPVAITPEPLVERDGPARTLSIDWGSVRADAIVTDRPDTLAVVRVADCAPVLLSTSDGRVVAAVHAGWRGTIAGVVTNAVRVMRRLAGDASAPVIGAIGPCIGVEHFEIGPEVVLAFRDVFGADVPLRDHHDGERRGAGKAYVDLRRALALQLAGAGVSVCQTPHWCTVSRPELFFSHRRDRGVTGRMVGAIGPANHSPGMSLNKRI